MLLLGPRQTGKTTLAQAVKPDLAFNLIRPDVRLRFERKPAALLAELEALPIRPSQQRPLVFLDEVQRVPELINVTQDLVCRTPRRMKLGDRIMAIPWQELPAVIHEV